MLAALGSAIARRPHAFAFVAVATALACIPLTVDVLPRLKAGGLEDAEAEAWRVRHVLTDELGHGDPDIIAVFTAKAGRIDDVETMTAVLEAVGRAENEGGVVSVASVWTRGAPQLLSLDGRSAAVVVTLGGEEHARMTAVPRIEAALAPRPDDSVTMQTTGIMPLNVAVAQHIQRDLVRGELIALPIIVLLLLWIFGSVASALIPVLVAVMANLLAFGCLWLLANVTDVSIFAVNIVTLLALGLAVDGSLFMVTRFREELLARPSDVAGAIARTQETAGRVVLFSGVVVAFSMLGLLAFPQVALRSIGIAGIVTVLGTETLVLVFVPAALSIVGARIDAGRIPWAPRVVSRDELSSTPFYRLALAVMRRPVLTVVVVSAALLIMATPFLRVVPSVPDHKLLPRSSPERIAAEDLRARFLGNLITPHEVILRFNDRGVFERKTLEDAVAVQRALEHIDPNAKVISVFSAIPGAAPAEIIDALLAQRAGLDPLTAAALRSYATERLLRFTVLVDDAYNSPDALSQVAAIRALSPPSGARIEVGGASAVLTDLLARIDSSLPKMLLLIGVAMFAVLAVAFRSVVVPLKAIVMNCLSMAASFGALVWIFQDGRFQDVLGYECVGFTDATQPIFMFSLVFGLSMDYEVLLLARVREEAVRSGTTDEAIARALARTGRIITQAALLFIVVVGAFGFSDILSMKQLGLGMALAVLLDATIVRALLVPATLKLLGRYNWWPGKLS